MKSLKVKKIILKNPPLRNLRKNLRIVLRLAIFDKIRELSELEGIYINKREQGKQVPSQRKREIQLSQLKIKLRHLMKRSCITCDIIYCESHRELFGNPKIRFDERTTDLDMVWIPWDERWVCVKCYDRSYKDMTLDDFIDSYGEILVVSDESGKIERNLRWKFRDSFVHK